MKKFLTFYQVYQPTYLHTSQSTVCFRMDQLDDDLVPTTYIVVHNSGLEMSFWHLVFKKYPTGWMDGYSTRADLNLYLDVKL
jgi:hypothetical protein